jgi:hypothetical protein
MEITPALKTLLDEGARFDPAYGGALADHRPMALVALERLGAGAERLHEWAAGYETRLAPAPPPAPWPAGDAWPGRFGEAAAWPAYRSLFAEWIAQEGARDMLAQVLPPLMPGCAAAAFHGLIRTAYAVQVGHLGELAAGLAQWAATYTGFGALAPLVGNELQTDPAALLRRLRTSSSGRGLIQERMVEAGASGQVNRAIAPLVIDEHTPERLARAAAFAYAQTGNFTALHLITGTHAMRVLARFVDEGEARMAAWRAFWQAYAHGVVAARLVPASAPAPLLAWSQIVPVAMASEDEHVIKLVDSCREEEGHYGGEDWRQAASRLVAKLRAGGTS